MLGIRVDRNSTINAGYEDYDRLTFDENGSVSKSFASGIRMKDQDVKDDQRLRRPSLPQRDHSTCSRHARQCAEFFYFLLACQV